MRQPKKAVHAVGVLALTFTLCARPLGQAQAADAGEDAKNTEKLVDAYVTVMTMAYPPAGAALKAAKGMMSALGWFDSPDLVAAALKVINQRLSDLETRMDALEKQVEQIKNELFRTQNLARIRQLRNHRRALQGVLVRLQQKPTDKSTKVALANDAQVVAEEFLVDMDLWMWSDLSLKTHRWDNQTVREGQMIPPDFKPLPAMEYYTLALATWVATMEYAGEGNTAFVKSTYGGELQKHIDFLSVRPGWNKITGTPETLPEHVKKRVNGMFVPSSYPEAGACHISEYTRDGIARQILYRRSLQTQGGAVDEMCNVPPGLSSYPSSDEEDLERAYGTEVMGYLAEILTRLKNTGTVKEQFIGTFAPPGPSVQPSFLYAVKPDGRLTWFRHDGAAQGLGANQSGAWIGGQPASGTGWGDFKQVAPGGGNVVYAVTHEGNLLWYRHNGFNTGARTEWEGAKDVGAGWNIHKHVFGGGGRGILYAMTPEGKLRWHKHTGYADGTREWEASKEIGTGWGNFKHVFSAGDGIIYAVTLEGKLLWYQHLGHATGAATWQGPKEILRMGKENWANYKHVFSAGRRGSATGDKVIIYAISNDSQGRLFWYGHGLGQQTASLFVPAKLVDTDGTVDTGRFPTRTPPAHSGPSYVPANYVARPQQVGHGWGNVSKIFTLLPGTLDAVR